MWDYKKGIHPMAMVWNEIIKPICWDNNHCYRCKFWSEPEYKCLFRLLWDRIDEVGE